MILVDTSIWVDHFRSSDLMLEELLGRERVCTHPFVIGELALGSMSKRGAVLAAIRELPLARSANDDEVYGLIERQKLYGMGIGYVDAHLLASVLLTPGAKLWTRDRRLWDAATRLKVCHAAVN